MLCNPVNNQYNLMVNKINTNPCYTILYLQKNQKDLNMGLFEKLFKKTNAYSFDVQSRSSTAKAIPQHCFAVIDTETNWADKVMSIGIILADANTNAPIGGQYYIITPAYRRGGMYSGVLNILKKENTITASRREVINDIKQLLKEYDVSQILAYNAKFDYNHLPELSSYDWYDIMRLAAYKQYNKCIPSHVQCCKTGRMKRGFGVEPIYQMLSGNRRYREIHNAFTDAVDELKIVEMLGYNVSEYEIGRL